MIRLIYNLLYPIGLLLFLPAQILKMFRRGNYQNKFGQRFGIYDRDVRSRLASRRCTWMHAVSVGEVAIALKLATKLEELDPTFFCVLSTTTTTGFAMADGKASERMEVIYSPLDFWPITRRAYAVIRPVRVVLVEAEVWPNLAGETRTRGIPLALVNARLSERSERRFHQFHFLVAPSFRCLDLVCVQEPEDIQRWIALGIPAEKIRQVGSIKYDPTETKVDPDLPRDVLRRFGINSNRPILLGGSTHAGEEEILAKMFQKLQKEFPTLKLIIAPRHVERTREIRVRLEQLGLNVRQRSEANGEGSSPDCLLLDTTGELSNWYAVATIVFVGKSLTTNGGQNPVEPILAGKPVLFGPHMENFSALVEDLVAHEAVVQVADVAELETEIERLLRDPDAAARLVANAKGALAAHRGATGRTADLLLGTEPRMDTNGHE
jgi:3-deoxy-D-manno-octulosonic-acid transferase